MKRIVKRKVNYIDELAQSKVLTDLQEYKYDNKHVFAPPIDLLTQEQINEKIKNFDENSVVDDKDVFRLYSDSSWISVRYFTECDEYGKVLARKTMIQKDDGWTYAEYLYDKKQSTDINENRIKIINRTDKTTEQIFLEHNTKRVITRDNKTYTKVKEYFKYGDTELNYDILVKGKWSNLLYNRETESYIYEACHFDEKEMILALSELMSGCWLKRCIKAILKNKKLREQQTRIV